MLSIEKTKKTESRRKNAFDRENEKKTESRRKNAFDRENEKKTESRRKNAFDRENEKKRNQDGKVLSIEKTKKTETAVRLFRF